MTGLNYFLRRIDSDVLNRKFINALNKCSERYNSIKENYPQSLTWFKNFVTSTLIMSLERMVELEEDITSRKIQDSLKDYYSDEIEERWNELQEFGIRESITRILREESSVKKKISALIDEYGLYEAAKILGLSFRQIVKISKHPINPEIANEILIQDMIKGNIIDNYKGFIIHASNDGVFYWEANMRTGHFSNDRVEQITVAATPFWDGLNYTPVELDWFTLYDKDMVNVIYSVGGEGDYFSKFTHQTNFETVEELNEWYNEVYLPGVYDIIMNKLLPKLYRRVDFELNPR